MEEARVQKGGLLQGAVSAVSDGERRRSRVQKDADSGLQSCRRDNRDKGPVNAGESPLARAGSGSRSAANPHRSDKLQYARVQARNPRGLYEDVMSAGPDMT